MKKILAYHTFHHPELFEKQLQFLQDKDVLLTVDDGDLSFYENGYKLIVKYKIPCILFVITSLIDTNHPFWWDEIEYYLGEKEGNQKIWEVKLWPNAKREEFIRSIRDNSSKPKLTRRQLSINQLRKMQEAGIVIANHSHTHPMFNQCTFEELDNEMKNSTEFLKENGLCNDIFAYPNGNYSLLAEKVLKKYGVRQAYLFDHRINKSKVNPLRLSRLIVNDNTPLWKFKFIFSGWHSKILPLTKALGKLKK